MIEIECIVVICDIFSHNGSSSDIDEVVSAHFRDKWKTARGSEVTFDDFDLIFFGEELDIKWSCDTEFSDNFFCDFLDLSDSFDMERLSREYHGRISRVDSCILDVFRDSVYLEDAILSHTIYFYFFCTDFELRYHCRECLRYLYGVEEFSELYLIDTDTHIGS